MSVDRTVVHTQQQGKSSQFAPVIVAKHILGKKCPVSKLAPLSSINPLAQKLTNLAQIPLLLWGVRTAESHLKAHLLGCLSAKTRNQQLGFPSSCHGQEGR